MNPTTGVISGTIVSTAEGNYTVTVRASDDAAFDEETFAWIVTPILNVPPICTAASIRVDMWPSNHKERDVTITGVVDPDGGALRIQFTSILQDEPTDSEGQGNTKQDAGIESNGARAWVRAERAGTGDGRVYSSRSLPPTGTMHPVPAPSPLACRTIRASPPCSVRALECDHRPAGDPATRDPGREGNAESCQKVNDGT